MRFLEKLYDEVAPGFKKIMAKRDEVAERIKALEADMETAEENYDIGKMEKLSTSLSSAKRVYERIEADIEKHRVKVNGSIYDGKSLISALERAQMDGFTEKNNSQEIQAKFTRLDELNQEIETIQDELKHKASDDANARRKQVSKFKHFITKNKDVYVYPSIKFHQVLQKRK